MKREALFIGGTGTISMAITRLLASGTEWHLTLLNRGSRSADIPAGVDVINVKDVNDEKELVKAIEGRSFDCVCDFIGFVPAQIERDIRVFTGRTKQFMYISSASAYHKPVQDYRITEGTALSNKYWGYSRNKIACERLLNDAYQNAGFPMTVIRPSHTYDERSIPMGVHGSKGSYQNVKRMLEGKPVIIQGDGTSLWHMTFNEDFASAFVGLMGNPHAIGEAFQITGDETLTWNQIYAAIADALGVELKPYYVSSEYLAEVSPKEWDLRGGLLGDKSNSVVFDNSKLKAAVPGYRPHIRFEEGVRRAVEYVLSHKECQVEDPEFDAWCDRLIEALENAKKQI